jgi:ATP-dependent DNA helicase RecG
MRYFVAPALMRDLELPTSTTLQRIEPHRLKELILEDLRHYPGSPIGQINQRIGSEINAKRLKRAIDESIEKRLTRFEGDRKARRYWPVS